MLRLSMLPLPRESREPELSGLQLLFVLFLFMVLSLSLKRNTDEVCRFARCYDRMLPLESSLESFVLCRAYYSLLLLSALLAASVTGTYFGVDLLNYLLFFPYLPSLSWNAMRRFISTWRWTSTLSRRAPTSVPAAFRSKF